MLPIKFMNNTIHAISNLVIYQPIAGEIISLEQINDGIFSKGILGNGCGIKPTGEHVFSPVNGEIIFIADTKHAVGIKSDDGIEVLLYVGLDTVIMGGEGYYFKVHVGDKVKVGQLLFGFSLNAIEAAGLLNTTDYSDVSVIKTGNGSVGNEILQVTK